MIPPQRQIDLLTFIWRNEPCAQFEISEALDIGMVTAWKWCQELKRLELITYIERQNPSEPNEQSVWLTDAGRAALADYLHAERL